MDGKTLGVGMTLILLISSVNAIKVGVIVEYPNGGIHKECITVQAYENGYSVMEKTSLSIDWSFHELWGHSLCSINEVGCPSENCWCNPEYWGFYVMHTGENEWTYSPTGFDGGSSCEEHYCAHEGDLIGLAYGEWGTKPKTFIFNEVCPTSYKRIREKTFNVSVDPSVAYTTETIKVTVLDKDEEPIPEVTVEVYAGKAGVSKQVFSGKTDENGETTFTLQEEGDYEVRVNAADYHPPQEYMSLKVIRPPTTTTTTTTTTSTSTTTTTTSTTTSTTTTSTTTTTTSTTSTTTTIQKPEITGKAISNRGYGTLVAALLVVVVIYAIYAKQI